MAIFTEEVTMKFHPRAFAAFGSDLVTNDCVAIAELVKNSYDAFANRVYVSIENGKITIEDDGCGMTADIIRDAWAVIATPYKQKKPFVEKNGKIRRVSGNKGLGRFSAARLGRYLKIITKSNNAETITALIDWKNFANAEEMGDCKFSISFGEEDGHIGQTGTYIEITDLYSIWEEKKIEELKNSLSRLLSPFNVTDDFSITLNYAGNLFDRETFSIQPQEFIQKPTYSIKGDVTANGDIIWKYKYLPKAIKKAEKEGTVLWKDACKGFEGAFLLDTETKQKYIAGNFSFEIRAWDLDSQSIGDVADTFNLKKREVRSLIAQYKGLSIYRDNVLVLPKSDASKDWLGIDIRRVSQIGKRLSTSQIIGMISISAENNPEIKDTTDREKLVDTIEYKQFCKIIETIIVTLENLRFLDKMPNEKKASSMSDLISPLSSAELVQKVEEDVKSGKTKEEILETVQEYAANNEKILGELNERLIYYAQTASLGSVAIVILHEILTGMTVIKRFLSRISKQFKDIDAKTKEYLTDAETWHLRLVDVANSFAPLYRKNLRKESHPCVVNEEIHKSIRLISSKKAAKDVEFIIKQSEELKTNIFAGELQTILVNLFDNALYWINYSKKETKKILIKVKKENGKIIIIVSDTGTGIDKKDVGKIFMPGVTAKPHGIGMGLVIVTELLHNYDCKIGTVLPGELGGATFIFELPLVEEEK